MRNNEVIIDNRKTVVYFLCFVLCKKGIWRNEGNNCKDVWGKNIIKR